jgi:ribosomal protein L7/L12
MTVCPYCNHENAQDAERCEGCGAWLTQDRPTTGSQSVPGSEADAAADREFDAELVSLLREGKKIAAIKRYREETGAGLKDAKDAVEEIARRLEITSQKAGCAGVLLVVLTTAAATLAMAF